MGNLIININKIEHVNIYIFGSFLVSSEPEDIDILFTFDSTNISYKDIYKIVDPIKEYISIETKLPVHAMVLSRIEETNTQAIKKYKCHEIEYLHLTTAST